MWGFQPHFRGGVQNEIGRASGHGTALVVSYDTEGEASHPGTLGNWITLDNKGALDRAGNGHLGEDGLAELVRLRKRGKGAANGA